MAEWMGGMGVQCAPAESGFMGLVEPPLSPLPDTPPGEGSGGQAGHHVELLRGEASEGDPAIPRRGNGQGLQAEEQMG